jgi:hypothetical protein
MTGIFFVRYQKASKSVIIEFMEREPSSVEQEQKQRSAELAEYVLSLTQREPNARRALSSVELAEIDNEEGEPHIEVSYDPYEVRRNTPAKREVDENDPTVILGYN